MSKQRYCVFRELIFHCGNGEPDYETSKELGYTWAVSQEAAIRNVKHRKNVKPLRESLYGPGISERYVAKEA